MPPSRRGTICNRPFICPDDLHLEEALRRHAAHRLAPMDDREGPRPEDMIVKGPTDCLPPDNSNTQFGVLGLLFAQESGYQVSHLVWERLRDHYLKRPRTPTEAGRIPRGKRLRRQHDHRRDRVAGDMSRDAARHAAQAVRSRPSATAPSTGDELALRRTTKFGRARHLRLLRRSSGWDCSWDAARSEASTGSYSGADALDKVAKVAPPRTRPPTQQIGAAFAVLFLARGLEPIIINKLERRDTNDWNNDPYDVKHLAEYITAKFQRPVQWRIVTLDAPVDFLLKVPILFINGHEALQFTDADKAKLKEYVEPCHAGYPVDAAAVLLIELEGIREAVETQVEQVRAACLSSGAIEFRVARTAEERERLWSGRKNAFGAVGRVSPSYYVQDGVVPRTRIAATLQFIAAVAAEHGLTISNIFHAGDGNLHPIILFNPRVPGEKEKARHAGEEILKWCIGCGGSITGEHGVGMEKNELMPLLFSADTLETIGQIKLLFDPESRMNPGKLLPTGRGCSEIRQPALQPGSLVY